MPGDMADSIDWFVADEGLLGADTDPATFWTDAQNRTTPIVLLGNDHLVNAHRFAKNRGMSAGVVGALAQEIARRGIVLDDDGLPTIPFETTVPTWKDAAGAFHPIPQMDTRHLLNAHRFARRAVLNGSLHLDDGIAALGAEIAVRGLTPLPLYSTPTDDAPPDQEADGLRF